MNATRWAAAGGARARQVAKRSACGRRIIEAVVVCVDAWLALYKSARCAPVRHSTPTRPGRLQLQRRGRPSARRRRPSVVGPRERLGLGAAAAADEAPEPGDPALAHDLDRVVPGRYHQ